MTDTNNARKNAVIEAWKNEGALVRQGKGTRDWSQRQQIGMIRKGQVSGFHGHHMQSVKTHKLQAGNPHNIQFLNKTEHIKGAHQGKTQNSTDGYYNPKTGTRHPFGKNSPQAPQTQLSQPLSQKQINSAVKREHSYQTKVGKDTAFANQWRQSYGYAPIGRASSQGNKGIQGARQKMAQKQQSGATQPGKSANKGLSSFQSKTGGQSASTSKGNASSAIKGKSSSAVKSGGSSSGGKSSGGKSSGSSSGGKSGGSSSGGSSKGR